MGTSNDNTNIQTPQVPESSTSFFNVKDFLGFAIKNWYWFLISVIICLGVAYLKLASTPNIYTASTKILIKDPTFGNAASSVDLSPLGITPKYANLDNETAIFISPDLMEAVVKTYGLNNSYRLKETFKSVDLYKREPLTVTRVDGDADAFYGFTMIVNKNGSFTLYDFYNEDGKIEKNVKGKIGETLQTPVGKLVFDRPSWAGDYFGLPILYSHTSVRSAANVFSSKLTADTKALEGTLITIATNDESPARAKDVLNGIVQAYNDQWINDKKSIADATSNFIDERLNVIERELGSVDSDISSFKSRNLVPDISSVSQMQLQQSNSLQQQYYDLTNQVSVLEFIRGELAKESIEETLPTNMGLSNSGIEGQIAQYNQLVIERNRLLSSLGQANPIVAEKGEMLHTMKRNIQHSAATYLTSLQTRIRGVQSQESSTNSQLASAPKQANYLLSVERQQKVKESLYLFLLQKREENELSQAFTSYNTQVVRTPDGPGAPISPKRAITYLTAFLIGLAIPVAIFILRATMDTKIRSRKDIESLGIPFIGEIPQKGHRSIKQIVKNDSNTSEIVVKPNSTNILNEAFRVVRTNLDFFVEKESKESHTIMITSANPGSGKTFISINLAVALALKGKRVLVIDFDLRRASLSRSFGTPIKGIANYLIGDAEIDEIIHPNERDIEGFDIIGVGKIPPNPSELLYHNRLKKLLQEVKNEYDFILFDCPPVEVVADARILNAYVDTTVFVLRAGLFDRRMLGEVKNFYTEHKYKNLCLLLNGTSIGHGYGYGYGYGYYGYRYYGYGKEKKRKKNK